MHVGGDPICFKQKRKWKIETHCTKVSYLDKQHLQSCLFKNYIVKITNATDYLEILLLLTQKTVCCYFCISFIYYKLINKSVIPKYEKLYGTSTNKTSLSLNIHFMKINQLLSKPLNKK